MLGQIPLSTVHVFNNYESALISVLPAIWKMFNMCNQTSISYLASMLAVQNKALYNMILICVH